MNHKEIIAKLEAIEDALSAIKGLLAGKPEKAEAPKTEKAEEQPALSKEDVRKLLVEKSNMDGGAYRAAVKDLVRKYSETGQLSTISPEHYPDLMKELEAVGNA